MPETWLKLMMNKCGLHLCHRSSLCRLLVENHKSQLKAGSGAGNAAKQEARVPHGGGGCSLWWGQSLVQLMRNSPDHKAHGWSIVPYTKRLKV